MSTADPTGPGRGHGARPRLRRHAARRGGAKTAEAGENSRKGEFFFS
jgi:hypothetical protein